jgi:hypothetical protein
MKNSGLSRTLRECGSLRQVGLGIACALITIVGGSASAEIRGERSFAFVGEHDPTQIVYALRYGADVVTRGKGEFRLYLTGGRSVLAFVPVYKPAALVHREYHAIRAKAPQLQVIACKEMVDRVKAAAKAPSIPFLPGVSVVSCKDQRKKLLADGWTPALGM